MTTLKLWIKLVFLLSTSISIYAIFYQWYIPQYVSNHPIYFQYDVTCQQLVNMIATSDSVSNELEKRINDCKFTHYDIKLNNEYFFQRGQLYNFELLLEMPDSYTNRNLGMFMVRLRLYDMDGNQLFMVARPALFPYQSMYVRIIKLVAGTLLHIFGFIAESHQLKINLIDGHVPMLNVLQFDDIVNIRIEIETHKLVEIVPPSQLRITARLEGLKYWMHFWPITSSIVITCFIFTILLSAQVMLYIGQLVSDKSFASTHQLTDVDDDQHETSRLIGPIEEPVVAEPVIPHGNDFH